MHPHSFSYLIRRTKARGGVCVLASTYPSPLYSLSPSKHTHDVKVALQERAIVFVLSRYLVSLILRVRGRIKMRGVGSDGYKEVSICLGNQKQNSRASPHIPPPIPPPPEIVEHVPLKFIYMSNPLDRAVTGRVSFLAKFLPFLCDLLDLLPNRSRSCPLPLVLDERNS